MFNVRILGTCSAIPAYGRLPSSQLITHNDKFFLIDCGEGTQFQLQKYRIRYNNLEVVLISHLHGDHVLGLPGLLTTMSILNREKPLIVIGPIGLRELVEKVLFLTESFVKYKLSFIEIENEKSATVVYENKHLTIWSFPLKHRITTYGYKIVEKPKKRKFLVHQAYALGVPKNYFSLIKAGNDYINEKGEKFSAELFLGEAPPSYSYAYCSDTAFSPEIVNFIKNVHVLYHEATFLEEHTQNAEATYHSTAAQAATIASLACVQKLIIGHFSARYPILSQHLIEAQNIFPHTELAKEGYLFDLELL
ncbi:MAG: ribonuclease Z [Bacteroidia bacterium]|nr:ribonuclease Z [Bacteroidia bacterium]MDW8159634.1 ribonuclease Z [Bacteroidia bacterium]